MTLGVAPLMVTKIRPPRRARGVIARPRLDDVLDEIGTRRLTLVKAPPGFGKTTAALSWVDALAGRGHIVAWLSLGPEDDEPERFLSYVEAALGQARTRGEPGGGERIAANFALPREQRLNWLIDELAAEEHDVFLFLDDFQVITDRSIRAGLSVLLRHSAENLHLVVLSREDVDIDLAQWRARDALFELDASSLLFTPGETDQLLQRGELGAVAAGEAAALHAMTGGWIAALRAALATARTQTNGAQAQYLQRLGGSMRPIAGLFGDLLDHLPPAQSAFLEAICITERQCAGLAEALSGRADAQAALEALESQQIFCSHLDDQGLWFALHPLFREFLERRLRTRAESTHADLQRRAAQWFAGNALWAEAIHHALLCGDIAQALRWIEDHAMTLVGDGDILTLLSWEKQLSAHLVESPARLRLAFAWALSLAMVSDRAQQLLNGVEASVDAMDSSAERDILQRECQALRSVLLSERGDHEAALRLAEQCRTLPSRQPWVPNAVLNVIASSHLHAGRWEKLYMVPPPAGDPHDRRGRDRTSLVYRQSIIGLAEYRQGHLDEAERVLSDAMALGDAEGGRSPMLVALPAPTLALVYYERNDVDAAERLNNEHLEVNRRVAPIDGLAAAYRVAARVARVGGQTARARGLLEEAERVAVARGWTRVIGTICLERVRFSLIDGRAMEASACLQRLEGLAAHAPKPSLEYLDLYRAAVLARAWRDLFDGNHAAAARSLEPQLRAARAAGKRLDEFCTGTALALAWQGGGRDEEALRLFLDLCRRAEAVGALRAIMDQPVAVDRLLGPALEAAQDQPDAERLRRYIGRLGAPANSVRREAEVAAFDAEHLSPREHHILKLISQGQSNKEIARNLGIASETVKSHIKKIFSKLGVQSRAQAAAKLTVLH